MCCWFFTASMILLPTFNQGIPLFFQERYSTAWIHLININVETPLHVVLYFGCLSLTSK